jgi:hypothetical protein
MNGQDALSFIPGRSGPDRWASAADEHGLQAAAQLLRAYHGAVSDWDTNRDVVWFDGSRGIGGHGRIVCHGDFHPCNIVWDGVTPVASSTMNTPVRGRRMLPLPAACRNRRDGPGSGSALPSLGDEPDVAVVTLVHSRTASGGRRRGAVSRLSRDVRRDEWTGVFECGGFARSLVETERRVFIM